jgi:hypothetical protein
MNVTHFWTGGRTDAGTTGNFKRISEECRLCSDSTSGSGSGLRRLGIKCAARTSPDRPGGMTASYGAVRPIAVICQGRRAVIRTTGFSLKAATLSTIA